MRLPPQLASVLCILQTLSLVGAILLVGAFRKAHAKIVLETYHHNLSSFPATANFFYYCGHWILLMPAMWGCYATMHSELDNGCAIVSERQSAIGWALTAMVFFISVIVVWQAFQGAFVVPFEIA